MTFVHFMKPNPQWFTVSSEKIESINNYRKLTLEVKFNKLFQNVPDSAELAFVECLGRFYALGELVCYVHACKFKSILCCSISNIYYLQLCCRIPPTNCRLTTFQGNPTNVAAPD